MSFSDNHRIKTDLALVTEIWTGICSSASKPSLLNLRLTSSQLCATATPWAFRSLRLEGYGPSHTRFIQVSKSPELRASIREVTIDTWFTPSFEYNASESYEAPMPFMQTIPYWRFFDKVITLHLRFNELCGMQYREEYLTAIEETWEF
ncbi:hypothetical protein NM208_g174 [Fusarium decemcellulare]|uniref:Uncharacterized protein n=1 Tax=Fusarium decemcellulare TaxID=57161 RepID=A0ACC1T0J6_9HYPO|nr:hypothetical protein NM208_g174 [Fusarium decemcellulare]